MTIQQVLYVLEVADLKSVSQAAQRLYISQSALSQQLRRLEEELDYPLFTRSAHGLQLTPEGKRFCEEAAPVAEQWRELCKSVKKDQSSEKVRLRIGIGSRVYSNGLFNHVIGFFESHPMLEVTMVTEAGRDVLDAMRKGELDLALDRLPPEEDSSENSQIYACPLIRERQCVLVGRNDPRAERERITFRDLQGCTIISGLEDSAEDRAMKNVFRKYRITVDRIYRSDGIDTNMRLVRDGMGIALGPQSFADYFQVVAVPLDPETWDSLQFLCLRSSLKRPETRQFRDYLLDVCRRREAGETQPETR